MFFFYIKIHLHFGVEIFPWNKFVPLKKKDKSRKVGSLKSLDRSTAMVRVAKSRNWHLAGRTMSYARQVILGLSITRSNDNIYLQSKWLQWVFIVETLLSLQLSTFSYACMQHAQHDKILFLESRVKRKYIQPRSCKWMETLELALLSVSHAYQVTFVIYLQ